MSVTSLVNAADLAAAVRARRRALGLTQKQLALAAGLGRVAVLRLENDPDKCQLQTALRVADILGLDLSVGLRSDSAAAPASGAHAEDSLKPVPGYGVLPFEPLLR